MAAELGRARERHPRGGGRGASTSTRRSSSGVILFEKLGLPVLRKTRKTKSYVDRRGRPRGARAARPPAAAESCCATASSRKLKSTYVDALPALVAADGRLHTRFQQAVAATGRLSSVNPNLQNIPVRTEQGQQIRKAFVAAPGNLLLVADYSQIELRILAHIAAEPAMIEAFRSGRGHPSRHRGDRLRGRAGSRQRRAAARRQDDQLRDHLRHERLRPGSGRWAFPPARPRPS